MRVIWALCMTGIWYTLLMGQMYVFLLLICLGAWLSIKAKNPLMSGILIGLLAAVKPNFLVWSGLLLLSGLWVSALITFGTFAILSLLPLSIYGSVVNKQWIEMLIVFKAAPLANNMSIYGLISRLVLPSLGLVLAG